MAEPASQALPCQEEHHLELELLIFGSVIIYNIFTSVALTGGAPLRMHPVGNGMLLSHEY